MTQKVHVCAQCAANGNTCCQLTPGTEPSCFPLSRLEQDRILDHAGEHGAFVHERNEREFVANFQRLFPDAADQIAKLFPEHRYHVRLATRANGACVFLTDQGCALPREARPLYCRIFPFWIQGDTITYFTQDTCLAVTRGQFIPGIMNQVGTSVERIRTLHGRIRLAWGFDPHINMAEPMFASTAPGLR